MQSLTDKKELKFVVLIKQIIMVS